METIDQERQQSKRLLSHQLTLGDDEFEKTLAATGKRLRGMGDSPLSSTADRLDSFVQLQGFEFGRWLLANSGGLNGYWTDYMINPPSLEGAGLQPLEQELLESAPTVLATRERAGIFKTFIQQQIKPGVCFASLPCGLMDDLLGLDWSGCEDFQLVGIDLDQQSLALAAGRAGERGLAPHCEFINKDAWQLAGDGRFDLLSSNGLNIYEPDDQQVTDLYSHFAAALRPGGLLVTSYLTPPPMLTEQCEWRMELIDKAKLQKSLVIFAEILQASWACYRSTALTRQQLIDAGFDIVEIIPDRIAIFPTVVARRR